MYDNWIKVSIDTFQFNAGIVGFIYVMEFAEKIKGEDYDYDDFTLYINPEILNEDLANIYLDAMIEKYGIYSIVTQFLNIDFDNCTMATMKNFDNFCKRKTILNTCNLLDEQELSAKFIDYSICKDEILKRRIGKEILEVINSNILAKKYIYLADIGWSKMSILFNNMAFLIKQQGSFNINATEMFDNQLNNMVFNPVKDFLTQKPAKKDNSQCIQCGIALSKKAKEMTFIRDCVADMGKKKSVFWNKSADTYVCPVCNMIYSFMPLGFNDVGNNALAFVNANSNIDMLVKLNETILDPDEKNIYYVTFNTAVQRLINLKIENVNKLQLIIKDVDNHYLVNTIGKDKMELIKTFQKELQFISKYYIKTDEGFINAYKETILNLINGKNLFVLLNIILRQEYVNTFNSFNILKIQIGLNSIKNMEENMESNIKIAYVAKKYGNELRATMGKDADNKLNGFVYQLLNAVNCDNLNLFNDRVIRMYVSMQKPIPSIFLNNFKSTDDFKTIGYAYILGLKGENNFDNGGKNE